jgi:hypothetical protein
MGKLYQVGDYGEMKLGEFRKNIMQYTRNNLRSIIASSDPEIVEIAIDELTRRGEEKKDGGIMKARKGFFSAGLARGDEISPGTASRSDKVGPTGRDDPPDRGPPENVRRGGGADSIPTPTIDRFKLADENRMQQGQIPPPLLEGPGLSPFDVDEDIDEQINRSNFINTQDDPIPTGIKRIDEIAKTVNKFLPQKINRKFYYDNVIGRTVTLPDGTVITFDEDNYSGVGLTYDQLRKAGVIGAYGNTEMGQNAIDARGGPGGDSPPLGPDITRPVLPIEPNPTPILPVEPISPFVPPKDRKLPFQNYYVGSDASEDQLAYGKQMGVDPRMYGLTAFAADGGRIGYAGGGITDLRQGYFLGKIVKKIGKGVKKIAKSPLGKAALLAAGAGLFGAGPGAGLFGSGKGLAFKEFLMGGLQKQPGIKNTGILQRLFLKNPSGGLSLGNVNPFSAITALSALPLVFGTGQDEDDPNKFSRGEGLDIRGIRNLVARGNLDPTEFAFMPPDFYANAADGGRIGFADGGNDDDESIRSAALSSLTPYRINRSAGGGTGYAPVTMQTEGNAAIVSGDDQSGPMAQGTTLPNQMPMRSPMPMMARGMNPMMARGMMNPMMARGMNPMMARGMPMMGGRMMMNMGGGADMGSVNKEIPKIFARDISPNSEVEEYYGKKNVDPIREAILKGVADGLFTFENLKKYDEQGVLPLEEITRPIAEPIAEPFYPDRFKNLKPIAEPFYPDRFKNLKPELMVRGGRIGAQEGGIMMASAPDPMDARNDMMENIAREEFGKPLKDLTEDEIIQIEEMMDEMTKRKTSPRVMAQEGGMMDMGGMEKDYRNEGGFVAIGGQERADDVPARLSKNEFVFTADAVRNAGGGNIDKGAEIMENMMENLEAGGKVSEDSQGLQGARAMFATQKRLGEVL